MNTPDENKARVIDLRQRDEEKLRRFHCRQKGINPDTGEPLSVSEKAAFESKLNMARSVEKENARRDRIQHIAPVPGAIHVRSRKGGRNRKVRRG